MYVFIFLVKFRYRRLIVNLVFSTRFLEWEFLSDCAISWSLPTYYLFTHIRWTLFEPHREKTGFLPVRKQRRRSASR